MPSLQVFPVHSLKSALRWRLNYFESIFIDSTMVKIPVINGVGRAHLDCAVDHIYLALKALSRRRNNMIDIGANIGQTLVKWFAIHGAGCKYTGFDVNTQCASYCEHLISANKISNAHVFPVGLGGEFCLTKLLLSSGATGVDPGASTNMIIRDSSFYSCSRPGLIVPVNVFQEDICSDPSPVIKLDIEGSEADVIEAFLSMPTLDSPVFLVEILPPCQGFGSDANNARIQNKSKIFELMRDAGFIGQNIRAIANGKDLGCESPDYLFFRSELPSDVQDLLLS